MLENLYDKKSILIGLCLGDGSIYQGNKITKSGLKHCGIVVKHGKNQKEYCEFKAMLLEKCVNTPVIVSEINNNGFIGYRFSKGHKYFRILRKWFYKNNIKVFSKNILNKLTPAAIALWYMDDGGLSAKKRNGKIYTYEIFLNTGKLKEENQVIIDYFKDKWNIQFHQVKNNNVYRLRVNIREGGKFLKLVLPYIPDCMKYKITVLEKFNKYII